MPEFIFLMHGHGAGDSAQAWGRYLADLRAAGVFDGGSEIGSGECLRKTGTVPPITATLTGYIRVQAKDPDHAKQFVVGNPVFEAGGTVEIRELPRS